MLFTSLLPPNSSRLERAVERACFQTAKATFPLASLWNPDEETRFSALGVCPQPLLPYLAWGLGIEIWNTKWTEQEKQRIIRKYLEIRRLRGTLEALKLAFEALGVTIQVKEWFEENVDDAAKRPYWFELKLFIRDNSSLVDEQGAYLIRWMTDRLKPLRSSYDLNVILTMDTELMLGVVFRSSSIQRIFGIYGEDMANVMDAEKGVQPIITKTGLSEWGKAADSAELKIRFSHVAIGRSQYDADPGQTSLRDELGRFEIADSRWMDGDRLHLTCVIEGPMAFDAGEIGLFTDKGVLFAVQAKAGSWMARKLENTDLLLSFDLKLFAAAKDRVAVSGNGERLNLSVAGELATLGASITALQAASMKERESLHSLETRLSALEERLK